MNDDVVMTFIPGSESDNPDGVVHEAQGIEVTRDGQGAPRLTRPAPEPDQGASESSMC